MLFNSWEFGVFFTIVFVGYWALARRHQAQNFLLLASSFLFYGWWDVRFLYLFLLTTVVDFFCALMIGRGGVSRRQRATASGFLVGAAFFCVTVHWASVSFHAGLFNPRLLVDWASVLPKQLSGWAVFLTTSAAVGLVNAFYPWMTRLSDSARRRVFVWGSVVSNLGVLGIFKYYNFFAESFSHFASALFHVTPALFTLHVILPVGISFYTFQSLAYTIDVYRRQVAPVERYLTLATFLSFFPQLVAGPIERATHMLPQFMSPRSLTYDRFREGMWLIFWGLFKKVVVADHMAIVVNSIFKPYDGASPSHLVPHDGLRVLLAVYAFALQIYGDFSGYSDMARGIARLLGFDLMLNFNLPYFAVTPSDFWARWHISLSTWLRDYLYIPLGGNRNGTLFTYRNLFLTMLLGGLWHGANWTFILWGAFHGIILIIYRLVSPKRGRSQSPKEVVPAAVSAQALVTAYSIIVPLPFIRVEGLGAKIGTVAKQGFLMLLMFQLTCIGWLLFRGQNLTAVSIFIESIFTQPHWSAAADSAFRDILFFGWFLIAFQVLQAVTGTLDPMKRLHWFARLNIWIFIIMSLFAFAPETARSFIYFAF